MYSVLMNRIHGIERAICTFDAFQDTYVFQIPTVYVSYYHRRRNGLPYEITGQLVTLTLQPKGVILKKILSWKAAGWNELQIANELAKATYVNSLLNYVSIHSNNLQLLESAYGITYTYIVSSFVTYLASIPEDACQAHLNRIASEVLMEPVAVDYRLVTNSAY